MARAALFGCFVAVLGQIAAEAAEIQHLPTFVGSLAAGAIAAMAVLLMQRPG